MEAIAFSTCVCGFTPRFAGEKVDSGLNRLSRIVDLIDECDFSLHDISRTELNPNRLPRFNMPFELGVALGRRYSATDGGTAGLLILDREPFRYHECFSDLSGCDPAAHYDQPGIAMHLVWKWLASQHNDQAGGPDERIPIYGPVLLSDWLGLFQEDMQHGVRSRFPGKWNDLPLAELVFSIRNWLNENTSPRV